MFRRSFSSILLQQQKSAATVTASTTNNRPNNNNNNNGNTAQRFGDLLRNNNNNNNNNVSASASASSSSSPTSSENRPFVRDIRSLRNRVKLDDFVQKRNDIAKLLLSNMNSNNNNNNGLSSSVRVSFDDPSSNNTATIANLVNEQLHNMSDRNGHILSDELIFQSLRINAESGDIITTAEILKRIVVDEGRLRNVSASSSFSPSIFDALNGIDLLLQSVLNLTSSASSSPSSVRSIYSEIVQNYVNLGSINNRNVTNRCNNPYLQLRIENKNKSSEFDQIPGGPLYSSLRCHVESIVKNILHVFVSSSSKNNQIHSGLESLFATTVHVAIAFDLFDFFDFKNSSRALNILHAFSVIENMSKSTGKESSSFELLDGALFSVYRQVFFAANVLDSQSSQEILAESTKYLKKIIVAKKSSLFPFSSLWIIDAIEPQNEDGIQSLIKNEIQLLKSFGLKNEDSSDQISTVTEYFEKIFNSNSKSEDQNVTSLSSDEKYLLPLLLLIVAESKFLNHRMNEHDGSMSTNNFYSETFNILRKIVSLSNDNNNKNNNNTDSNILSLSFDLFSEVFAKTEREILYSLEPATLDQVNAPFGSLVEEKMILKNLRLSLLAHQLFDQAEVLVSSSSSSWPSSLSQKSDRNEMEDVVGVPPNLKNSLANFYSIIERYLVKDDSDLGQQIALLEERKSLRKQELSLSMQQQNIDGSSDNNVNDGGEGKNSSPSENAKDDFDDDFSTSSHSTSTTTTNNNNSNKSNNSKKFDEEDEFDKILSNQNKTKESSSSSTTNSSGNTAELMDGNFNYSSDSPSHPSLRILALQRRQRKICNNDKNEKASKLHELLLFSRNDQNDEVEIVAGLSTSVFNRIFKNSRDVGDMAIASSMSEKRRSLYDPVKLI